MTADSWEPWLSELEQACDRGDEARLGAILENLWRFPFHEERGRGHEQWDRLFAVLVRLLASPDATLLDLADHYARIVMGAEYGPPFDDHTAEERARSAERRTVQMLPALTPRLRGGEVSLLRFVDDLVHVEGLADLEPQEIVREWIADVAAGPAQELAARIAYLDGRAPWARTGESLLECLDHPSDGVRAYAARALGRRYAGEENGLPPLPELVASLTAKEIERPGIAGPFFSNWYDDSLADFGRRAGVEVEDWFCTILSQRKSPEPNTLPCSNGIDFFAHEIFGGRDGYVRRLIDMGQVDLAVQAATEVDEPIEEMEPLLVELADHAEAEVCRMASWQLASTYRRLHDAGARRGFVGRQSLAGGAELFIQFASRPELGVYSYSAVLYPPQEQTLDAAQATAILDTVLPAEQRGDLQPFGMPGDGGQPGLWVLGRTANARYSRGALVQFVGDTAQQRWERVRVIWHGAPGEWRPERLAR
jgi:hypothetical protein